MNADILASERVNKTLIQNEQFFSKTNTEIKNRPAEKKTNSLFYKINSHRSKPNNHRCKTNSHALNKHEMASKEGSGEIVPKRNRKLG